MRVNTMLRATFVMEQHLGHYTYYQNIRQFIDGIHAVQASWVPVTYARSHQIWEHIPGLPESIRGTLRGRAQVREGLATVASDVVFFNTQVPAALAGRMLQKQPYVVATDLTPIQFDQLAQLYGHKPDRQGPVKRYKHAINTAMFKGAARLLPWSTWARDSLIEDYDVAPERITVLPPGVDLNRWTPGNTRGEGPLRVLFVGGDFHRKGGDLLLRTFRALPVGLVELVIVTRSVVPREEGVVVHNNMQPNSPELIALFQSCDVFVLPTEAEAFGIAAVEASASGLPVIATAIGGLRDVVVEGETGFLLRPNDQEGLARAFLTLAQNRNLRMRLGKGARYHAEMHFNARRNAETIIAFLLTATEQIKDRQKA